MRTTRTMKALVCGWLLLAILSPIPGLAYGEDKKKDDAPSVTLPATKTVKANRYFFLRATTNCTSIKWIIPSGLEQLDPEIQLKDPNAIGLIGDTGTYTVQCYGALAGQASDLASCVVTIGSPPPPTPPTPPTPPAPSALTTALQTAYNSDTDSNKSTCLQWLQTCFTELAKDAPTWTATTVAQASAIIQQTTGAATGPLTAPSVVKNLRSALQTELTKVFGSDASAAVDLKALTAELSTIATALGGVK